MFGLENVATHIPVSGFEWAYLRKLGGSCSELSLLIDPWVLNPTEPELEAEYDSRVSQKVQTRGVYLEARMFLSEACLQELWRKVFPFREVVPCFDRFASINPSKDAIRDFANSVGSMGLKSPALTKTSSVLRMHIPAREWHPIGSYYGLKQGIVFGDSLTTWLDELRPMKVCVELFRAILAGDEKRAARALGDRDFSWPNNQMPPGVFDLNSLGQSGWLISEVVSHRLKQSRTQLDFNTSEKSFQLTVAPESFRDAIWFEIAHALQDIRNFRECKICGHLFRISEVGRRNTKQFCSSKCRSTEKRRRQSKARQLRADGARLNQIAKELKTTVPTVKGWVKDVPLP